ncbi:hypothetical protein Hdeb2414_s0015g00449181 [Helianthus debilis subsp. tardiflorus]
MLTYHPWNLRCTGMRAVMRWWLEVETEMETERVKTVAAQGFFGGLCLFPA